MDLSKAFDSINHSILLHKLEAYGINSDALLWFRNYLEGRQQKVTVDGCSSDWEWVKTGVPQGSILGPLLFVLYVNDLPKVVTKCTVTLYADDITVYVAHKCSNVVTGYLNEDLDRIANWVEKNELRINISKTKFMAIGTKDYEGGVKLQGSKIPRCPEIKYLGVVIDQKLTWQSHVASLRKKSLAMISTISRVKSCLPVRVRQLLYKSLVLPQLDYCPTVWHTNCSNELSTKIERLQNYAMRIILD